MKDKTTWHMGTANLIGGGLDPLMILAALERIEEKLNALDAVIQTKRRKRREARVPADLTRAAPL